MKEYSQQNHIKTRKAIVFPVVSQLPDPLEIGETVYKQDAMFPGLYIYLGEKRWVTIMTPKNNIFEEHTAIRHQKLFTLATTYPMDGNSLLVYVNGVRLRREEIAEISPTQVIIKEDEFLQEGDRIEFQIFNKYEEKEVLTRPVF